MNSDLISRSALKEEMEKADATAIDYESLVDMYERLVDNAPTIPLPDFKEGYKQAIIDGKTNFSRPQGEWITRHKLNSFGQDVVCFECNKCGEYKVPLYHLLITEPLKVCPNCGADMRKGGAENG